MSRFLVQCILVVEADSPDDAHGVVLEEASSERWYPVKDVRTILGVWPDRREQDAELCPHGFGADVVCLQCHPERRETAKLPGFQSGEGMDAGAWESCERYQCFSDPATCSWEGTLDELEVRDSEED